MSSSLADLLAFGLTGSPWKVVLIYFIVVTQLTIFSVTLYLHRSAAHRGVDFHPVLSHFFRFWTWLTTAMVTKEWVAVHRKHHARCETEEDPHSPVHYGINRVLWRGVELYQDSRHDKDMLDKYGIGTPDDWIERNLYTPRAPWGPTLMLFINLALFGAFGLAVWAIQMAWIPFWAAGVVNGLGHWWGYRNFETADRATNLTPWGFFIGGEELHNNHHAFPSSAKFALRRWEFDIGWMMLSIFSKLKLAKVLRVAPAIEVRDVAAPDAKTLQAIVTHRFTVMTAYFRNVIVPVMREEANAASAKVHRIRGRLRRGLANDGRWLDAPARAKLEALVQQRPLLATVVEYRRRLQAVMERAGKNSDAMLHSLTEWCREAEASGIAALEAYSRQLRGYALATR